MLKEDWLLALKTICIDDAFKGTCFPESAVAQVIEEFKIVSNFSIREALLHQYDIMYTAELNYLKDLSGGF